MNNNDNQKLVDEVRENHLENITMRSDPARIMNEIRLSVLGEAYVNRTSQDEGASDEGIYSKIDAKLERARMCAYVGIGQPAMQRFKGLTRLLARTTARVVLYVTQLITIPQRQFNTAVVETLELFKRVMIEKDMTFLNIDKRFQNIEISIDRFDQRISSLQEGLTGLGHDHEKVKKSISGLGTSTDGIIATLGEIDAQLKQLKEQFDKGYESLAQLREQVSEGHGHLGKVTETIGNVSSEFERRLGEIAFAKTDGLTGKTHLEYTPEPYLPKAIARLKYDYSSISKKDKKHLFYSLFENVFYDTDEVQKKQRIYKKYFSRLKKCKEPFLDAGCGRGEFLKLLDKNNIKAIGVDLNRLEINSLHKEGWQVECTDINQYLKQKKSSYSGISAFQVIEHMSIAEIDNFLALAYSRIVDRGVIILETINPHAYFGFSRFYTDMTHKMPITPQVLQFMLEWHGFKNVKILFIDRLPIEYCGGDAGRNYQDFAAIANK